MTCLGMSGIGAALTNHSKHKRNKWCVTNVLTNDKKTTTEYNGSSKKICLFIFGNRRKPLSYFLSKHFKPLFMYHGFAPPAPSLSGGSGSNTTVITFQKQLDISINVISNKNFSNTRYYSQDVLL
jgi:hypothetical protein